MAFYEALRTRDADTVHGIVSPDLEWWFHGPPVHQFLKRILTSAAPEDSDSDGFEFVPHSVFSVRPFVIAEGSDRRRSIYWAHAYTVSDDGVITHIREYFNTSLTVIRLNSCVNHLDPDITAGDAWSSSSSSSPAPHCHCTCVWVSSRSLLNHVGKTVPGLILTVQD
ncbi:hypothetical protein SAY86_016855 [Trapa natans]|uniref:Wound-induced protein 1 n=1 Tax=Trapa natans TaxID=22666 RepID=A0AAN7LNC2_TRANT|nr:hypothetical protein SAY86_016855 [Trapa natans]